MIDIQFSTPQWLWFLLIAVLVLVLIIFGAWRTHQTRKRSLTSGLATHFSSTSVVRRWLRALCLIVASGLLALALAKPQWGMQLQNLDRHGRDFLLLLDVSLSMLAEDAKPNRLEHARSGIRDLVETLGADGGHRIGLIAFAGRAAPVVPLTYDYDLFLDRLAEVDTATPIRRGSQLGDAIRQALYGFGPLKHEFTDIIVLSDGEDHGSAPLDTARVAANLGVTIHTIGIGDATDGHLIPYTADGGRWLKYNSTEIISRMRPVTLVEIARITQGEYASAEQDNLGLVSLYNAHLRDKPVRPADVVTSERRVHRFQWAVALALALLILDWLLSMKPRARTRRMSSPVLAPQQRTASFILPAAVVGLSLAASPRITADIEQASALIEQGNQLYTQGDLHAASSHFERATQESPDSAIAHFNFATARIKLYDFGTSVEHFALALKFADATLTSKIKYNLGVVKHQQAVGNMLTFQDALTPLQIAITYYRESLELEPDNQDARYNLELAHRLAENIKNQNVQPQANAATRDQKTSDNKGQIGNEQGDRATQDAPDQGEQPPQQSDQTTEGNATPQQNDQNSQLLSTLVQRGEAAQLNADQAEKEIQLARQRAENMAAQRSQWRQARMEEDAVDKFW